MNNTVHNRIFRIARREVFRIATRPLYLFCMIIAPLFCYLFFTTLMWNGLPTDMPAGVVDLDNTATTRSIIRNLDAFQQTKIIAHYPSFADARKAMQQGKIYAFYYIPKGTTEKALASRQPKVSFYTNYSYLVAGSLLYKDQRTMSELAGGAIGRATLYAKGATEDQAMAFLQPIVIDSHVLNNPWLNYSVYLSNTIIPGILMLLIFMTTVYTIGSEMKTNTQKEWMGMADNSITVALTGKFRLNSRVIPAGGHRVDLHQVGHTGLVGRVKADAGLGVRHRALELADDGVRIVHQIDASVWIFV